MENFEKKMKCGLPWSKSKTICNSTSQEMIKALEEYKCTLFPGESCHKSIDTCLNTRPCSRIVHKVVKASWMDLPFFLYKNMANVTVVFNDEFVTYNEEYFTYDLQSYIGEVGGILGLFLGLSVESIFNLLKYCPKNIVGE